MFLKSFEISPKSLVTEIVNKDYRTADVFSKYGIEYCCGGNWPLETVCMMKGVELPELIRQLQMATRPVIFSNNINYKEWSIEFLLDYIINIHHHYLRYGLPEIGLQLEEFISEHQKKYPILAGLQFQFSKFSTEIMEHIDYEESTIFPYIRRLDHAYNTKESYAGLLIRTLRKPVENTMKQEHEMVGTSIQTFRELTNNYLPPEKACTNHKVVWAKLKELDNNLAQHMLLENEILFPRVLAMESELVSGHK